MQGKRQKIPTKTDNKFTSEKIREHLTDSSKLLADITANMVYDEPELLKSLLEVAWMDYDPWSQRASRVVCICCSRFPELFQPIRPEVIRNLGSLRSEGAIRNFLKIIAETPVKLTKKDIGTLLELCFDYLSGNFPVGIKVFSMEVLYKLSLEIPDIGVELYSVIESQLPDSSAGFKSRGEKILKNLMKQHDNRRRLFG